MGVSLPTDIEELLRAAAGYQSAGKDAQALPLFERAAELLASSDAVSAAAAWRAAGRCAVRIFDHGTAAECFHQAVRLLAGVPGQQDELARLHSNLAGALYAGCRLRDAEAAARQALALAQAAGDSRTAAAALYNLGLATRYQGRYRDALRALLRARRRYRSVDQPLRAADALHNAGWVYLDMEELPRAEAALLKARAERTALGEPVGRIDVELARLRLRRRDAPGALELVRRILDSAEALLDPVTHIQALVVAAEAAGDEDPAGGLAAAETALDLAASLGRPPVLVDLLPVLARLRRALGQQLQEREVSLLR